MPFLSPSDGRAVRRVLAGHPEAFEALVLRYQKKAWAIARSQGVPDSSLDDVVQESFLLAFRDLSSLQSPSRFGGWFLQIVRHTASRHLRRSPPAALESPEGEEAKHEESREEEDFHAYLWRKVAALPEGIREAVLLYYHEGESVGEVSRALGISSDAVKKRLQRGRDLLREELWRELERSIRDRLPSPREWRKKGRRLVLVLLASIPWNLRARAESLPLASSSGPGHMGTGTFRGSMVLATICMGAAAWFGASRPPFLEEHSREVRAEPIPIAAAPVVLPTAPHPAAPVDSPEPSVPAVILRVEDSQGRLMEKAQVFLSWKKLVPGGFDLGEVEGGMERLADGEILVRERQGDAVVFIIGAPGFLPEVVEREVPVSTDTLRVRAALEEGTPFRGQVVDGIGGAPLTGVRIGLLSSKGQELIHRAQHPVGLPPADLDASSAIEPIYRVESDGDGRFSLTGLPGAFWVVREGHAPTAVLVDGSWTPDPQQVIPVPLYPSTTLRLVVRRESGERVKGFLYSIAPGFEGLSQPTQKRERTDQAVLSLYTLARLQGGRVAPIDEIEVAVQSGARVARRTWKVERGRENRIEMVLPEGKGSFHGSVTDAEGVPISGARVSLLDLEARVSLGDDPSSHGALSIATDSDGRYEIPWCGRRPPFLLLAEHPDHPPTTSGWRTPDGDDRTELDLRLEPGARIVLRAERILPAGGKVELRSSPRGDLFPAIVVQMSARADASRGAVFEGVPPGLYTLTVAGDRTGAPHRVLVAARAGATHEIALEPPEGISVEGVVLDRGAPVEGRRVWIRSLDALHGTGTTDSMGRFSFPSVVPGSHDLLLLPSREKNSRTATARQIAVRVERGLGPLTIDASMTALCGRVASEGMPVGLVEVKLFERTSQDGDEGWRSLISTQTEADGGFRLPGAPQAPCVLVLRKAGFMGRVVRWQPQGALRAKNEEEVHLGELSMEMLEEPEAVRFRVASSRGGGEAERVTVEVHSLDEGPLMETLSRSDPEDPIELRGLPPGRYRALVLEGDRRFPISALEVVEFEHAGRGERVIPVALRPGGSVMFTVGHENGSAAVAGFAEALDEDGKPCVLAGNGVRIPFHGGEVLRGLPAGEGRLRIMLPGTDPFEVPIRVESGRAIRIAHVSREGDYEMRVSPSYPSP